MTMPMTLAMLTVQELFELAWLVVTVAALAHLLAGSTRRTGHQKLVWVVLILVLPFVGPAAYWWVAMGGNYRR